METQDINLTLAIKNGHKGAFDEVFLKYYKRLYAYAFALVKEKDDAEELVQNVFVRIWKKRDQLDPDRSLKSLLYRSLHNDCLNYLKHQKVRAQFAIHFAGETTNYHGDLQEEVSLGELRRNILMAINELPEKCREIFQMSRFENMKYQEIADRLQISVKTVENQMGKALKVLRWKVADFLILLIILFK